MSKTKQERREVTFASGASVPGGTVMYLTGAQAHDRGHLVRPVKDGHKNIKDSKRLGFVSDKPVFFKAGETVELEGEIDRGVALAIGEDPAPGTPAKTARKPGPERHANGDTPEMAQLRRQFNAAYDRARTDARRELLGEIEKRNALIDAADAAAEVAEKAKAAHEAEPDAEKRKPLQKALDDALEAQAKADKLVNDLPELKA
ncbi:hypothetical protein LJR016_004313 [Devosia sp. LjRoot16]|uniref:hypothetical protein n=1 Tax=Devosia sp. LjRoot16 TaxID=3342271 RepID=UPI003ECDB09D